MLLKGKNGVLLSNRDEFLVEATNMNIEIWWLPIDIIKKHTCIFQNYHAIEILDLYSGYNLSMCLGNSMVTVCAS